MPTGVAKAHLPTKLCPVCQRPFAWRRKWARDWERVVYCSERCRRQGPAPAIPAPIPASSRR